MIWDVKLNSLSRVFLITVFLCVTFLFKILGTGPLIPQWVCSHHAWRLSWALAEITLGWTKFRIPISEYYPICVFEGSVYKINYLKCMYIVSRSQ